MKVEKVAPEVVYKLELSTKEYNDLKRVLYWAQEDADYTYAEKVRYKALHEAFNSNV